MDVLMQNIDLVLKAQRLLTEESPLSPKKELDYRTVITGLTNKTTAKRICLQDFYSVQIAEVRCGITSGIIKKLHISLVAPITRVTEALVKVHIISVLILLK